MHWISVKLKKKMPAWITRRLIKKCLQNFNVAHLKNFLQKWRSYINNSTPIVMFFENSGFWLPRFHGFRWRRSVDINLRILVLIVICARLPLISLSRSLPHPGLWLRRFRLGSVLQRFLSSSNGLQVFKEMWRDELENYNFFYTFF